jgi:DNA-binding SARP family transcriptional activator/tetratricopeptide (TPR) repeat protein
MQVRLLGAVDVVVRGEPRPVQGQRRKAVLAVLALHGGEIVSTDLLADAVWGDAAPATAVNTLQSHVSYLRGVLGAKTAILARPPGYVLQLPGDGTDVQVAERLLEQGTQCADPAGAVRHLEGALALWRGQPLADVADLAWLSAQAEHLDVLRMRIRQALSEARLAAGEHAQLLPELEQLVTDYPLDERIHGQLMLALYRSGRQADALAVYHRLRQRLGEELGIDPSQALRDLETAILQQDPSLDAPSPGVLLAAPVAPVAPVPAQLPPAVPAFTGRGAELASLDATTPGAALADPATVVISAVSGTAGVGKTALAVHWAHRVAGQFPDGQLYVNLRGFDPDGGAMDPGQVLRGFLDAFGVPATRIPEDLAAQTGLFRSVLAGKQVLVVLDNARGAEQVRPLLPGTPGCLAIVTSRDQLAGLVATEGALPLAVGLLTAGDARSLLTRRLGADRVAAEPEAADRIIAACAGLPLALTIAAARAATSPRFPLAAIAAELREATSALDAFYGGESATDVRAVFSWSYRTLSAPAARMFRLLGLYPGPDITLFAAASLTGLPPGQARVLLAELTRAHLLAEHAPGRYAFHDLLRAYAGELARTHDDQRTQDAAVDRVLGHYLHSAHNAALLTEPPHYPVTLGPPPPGVTVSEPATGDEALGWFTAEQPTLLAAVQLAARTGASTRAWQLAWALSTFLMRRGLWHEQATACQAAMDAARLAGDVTGEARALQRMAVGYAKAGRFAQCQPLFEEALPLLEALGDRDSQAHVHRALSWVAERQQRPAEALHHAQRCYDLYRTADHPADQAMAMAMAMALQNIGHVHAVLGNYGEAIAYCERALATMREIGERGGEGAVWDSLGYIHHHRGDFRQAIAYYERGLSFSREFADRFNEADTLNSIGDVHLSAGDPAAAREAWSQALRILDEIDHPDRDQVRAKLRAHDHAAATAGRTFVTAAP